MVESPHLGIGSDSDVEHVRAYSGEGLGEGGRGGEGGGEGRGGGRRGEGEERGGEGGGECGEGSVGRGICILCTQQVHSLTGCVGIMGEGEGEGCVARCCNHGGRGERGMCS